MTIPQPEPFGTMPDGSAIEVFTLTNCHGLRLRAMTYGAVVLSLETPDRAGRMGDVMLGHHTLEDYLRDPSFQGTVAGRYANRIAHARFTLDGQTYTLAANNHPSGIACALHGGLKGFDKAVWKAEGLSRDDAQGVRFRHLSPHGDEGYPGNLEVSITYWLTDTNEWKIEYESRTDQATPVNLTQHAYFNLKGEGCGDILDHSLTIHASRFTPVSAGLIPTGELRAVAGTALDFTKPNVIGARIGADDEQLRFAGGYDHNFVLDHADGDLTPAACVHEPVSGRVMEVLTTEPGMQFYTGNFLTGEHCGKSGSHYHYRHGFCLETQHFPDSPNQPGFPTTILRPGETRRSTTIYRFRTA
jgi:aldose 1-epimerase